MRGLRLFLAITILAVANGCGGGASQPIQPPPSANLAANPASISFGNVAVDTTSKIQNVTLSAIGGSVSVTAINPQAPFVVSNVAPSLPATVSATQSLTFHVSFKPKAAGTVSLATGVSVVSNASNSPTNITLSGTGATGLSVSTTSVNFGNVMVDSTSTQNITLTASGQSFDISSIALSSQAPFKLVSAPTGTLNANTSETVQVSFTPTGAGAASGALTVVSNAPNSPNTISLSGTGTTGTSSACTGEPVTQTQTDVTSALGILSGVVVTQLTSAPSPLSSWNTYADVPLVATATNPNLLVTNYGTNPNGISIANIDGTNPQQINGIGQGTWAVVSVDGKYVAYEGRNSDSTADLYAVNLTASGTCAPANLSNLHLTFTPPANAVIYSTSQIDPTTGLNVFAFSEGVPLRTVESDGSHLQEIELTDPYEQANPPQIFHRFRLNPVFQNKIWWKRDAANSNGTATPEIWVADITNPSVLYNAAIVAGAAVPADHNSWSPDGTTIGFVYNGSWYTIQVLNSDGTWANGGSFGSATLVGPPSASGLAVDYCSWAPDGSEYVCVQGPNPAVGFTGEIYLMSLDGQTTTRLAYAGSAASSDDGIPKPHFGDLQHIYFSSDLSGTPQIYAITGFPAPQ